eukprot:sb/3467399/
MVLPYYHSYHTVTANSPSESPLREPNGVPQKLRSLRFSVCIDKNLIKIPTSSLCQSIGLTRFLLLARELWSEHWPDSLPYTFPFTLTVIFTGLLWVFRMNGILRPLSHLKPKMVAVFVIFIILFCLAGQIYFLQTTVKGFWSDLFCGEVPDSSSETMQVYANIGHLVVIITMSLVLVIVTVRAVKKLQNDVAVDERSRADKRAAAITVSIIVFIPCVAAIPFGCLFLYTSITYMESDVTRHEDILWEADFEIYKLYLMIIITSVMTSAVNPCVYLCRNRALKEWLKGWIHCILYSLRE